MRKPCDRLVEKRLLLPVEIGRSFGDCPVSPTESRENFPGMTGIEQIHQGAVLSSHQSNLQVTHESTGGEPEVIPHRDDRLNVLAVAMTKSCNQFGILLGPLGKQPLLELIDDQKHLPLVWKDATPSQLSQGIDQC